MFPPVSPISMRVVAVSPELSVAVRRVPRPGEFSLDLLVGARRRIGQLEIAARRHDRRETFAIFIHGFEAFDTPA